MPLVRLDCVDDCPELCDEPTPTPVLAIIVAG
jgi:hypothetical protein